LRVGSRERLDPTGAPETVVQSFFQEGAFSNAFDAFSADRLRPAATDAGTRGSFSLMRRILRRAGGGDKMPGVCHLGGAREG